MKKVLMYAFAVLVALVLVVQITGLAVRDGTEIPKGLAGKYIDIDGMNIRFHQAGQGPDILFIHGLPGVIEDGFPLIGPLSARFRLTFFDRPGQGYSGADKTEYSVAQNAKIALKLIAALKLKNVIVVGHSYGGSIALAMAVQNPPAVKCFVTIGGASYDSGRTDPAFYLLSLPAFGRGLAVLTKPLMGEGMVEEGMREAFSPNEKSMPRDIIADRARVFLQPKVTVTTAREEMNYYGDMRKIMPLYKNITKKFYIIQGDGDRAVPPADAERLHKELKSSRLYMLKDTGHMVQFVRTDDVVKVILEASK